jgi:hypothetical protein
VTVFVFINWILCIITSISLVVLLWRYRFLFVKPSIIVIIFFHLRIQWAATIHSGHIESYLANPVAFAVLSQAFPLIGLLISFFTFRCGAIQVWNRITASYYQLPRLRAVLILVGCLLVITFWYLSYVPLSSTGLYSIVYDPLHSRQAREDSLKLINNIPLKYAYAFLRSTFAPLLAIITTLFVMQNLKRKRVIQPLIGAITLLFILIIVSLTGARSPAAVVILSIIMVFFFREGMPIRLPYIIWSAVIVLSLPVLLTILRAGSDISISMFSQYFGGTIFDRIFHTPMQTGLWHVEYAQNFGYFGVAGIPKLAVLFKVDPINVANIISLEHFSWAAGTALSNTCYVFSYYSYFGELSVIFSLILLWMLDFSVVIYKMLSTSILLPALASIFVACISFVESDYTTVLLTFGFLPLLAVSIFLDVLCRVKLSMSIQAS